MEKLLKQTRLKFTATIISFVLLIVGVTWIAMQLYSNRQISVPANSELVHSTTQDDAALSQYINEQKKFEAHFINLATEIRKQDSREITKAMAGISVIVILSGTLISFFITRRFMKPVRAAYESQERFIQDAAHELRNPLAAMTVALQNAESSKQDDPLVKTFRRQTNRLIHINEDLLFLERQNHQDPQILNLADLLYDVVEELQPLASGKSVKIDIKSEDNISKNMVSSDYIRLVKNIIDNAIKYSKKGDTVTIRQNVIKGDIVIKVVDQGIGIPKSDQLSVGNRFFRASNTGEIDGTGLGLAIVKKILNIYRGDLEIKSTPKKGTTATIKLPA